MIESKHNNLLGPVAQVFDSYARQARLYPALIVILPVALLVVVWFPALWTTWGALTSLASSFGIMLLLAQVARDRGKRLEPYLYQKWDGKPSVSLLRHRDTRIDKHTKDRYREFLNTQLPQLVLPTAEEERADPAAADAKYQSVTEWLLTQTRDTKRFSILFKENVSFGFRRNLWGLKPIGIAVSLIAGLASVTAIFSLYQITHQAPTPEIALVTAAVWLLLLIWLTLVAPSWIRIPADAYGRQLLAASDTLSSPQVTTTRTNGRRINSRKSTSS
jgi:hypothetical protein